MVEYVKIACPECGARLRSRRGRMPKDLRCPKCRTDLAPMLFSGERLEKVPGLSGHEPSEGEAEKEDEEGLYKLTTPEEPSRVETSYLEVQAEIRKEEAPPPPEWTFFSGVFGYPWHEEALSRWIYLSLGCTALGLLSAFLLSMSLGVQSAASGLGSPGAPVSMAIAFFILPMIWICTWTFSYAAACGVVILEDTAGGNDRVINWPEPNWKEWAIHLIYLSYLASVAAVIGYGAGYVTDMVWGSFWPIFLIVGYVAYPLLLLSTLETASVWVPFSGPVFRSLISHGHFWLLYYVLSLLPWGVWLGLVWLGFGFSIYLTMLLTGPVLAAVLLIEARLMGRMAWKIASESEESAEG